MTDPVAQALVRIVEQSATPEEMTLRVSKAFGDSKLSHARQIAAETKGLSWLEQKYKPSQVDTASEAERSPAAVAEALRRAPSLVVLLVGAMTLLLVLLFPPFIISLPGGMVNNAGFGFILSPPTQGILTAVVNSPLLGLLALGILVSTASIYIVVRQLERVVGANRRNQKVG